MPNKIRFCVLCNRYDRTNRSNYTRIYTVERENKLLEGYKRRHNGQELNQSMLNKLVHHKCYNQIARNISTNDLPTSIEQKQEDDNDDNEEEQDQTSLIQFRSRMPLPSNINKNLFERRQRVCAICHRYGYRSYNKMKQIVSNFMANKLAEGYLYRYKKPYGQSLLDAYIHQSCFKKLYAIYRYHSPKTSDDTDRPIRFTPPIVYSPHETRSRTSLNKSIEESESDNLLIEEFLSTPLYTSIATSNPNAELSARSDRFRPCIQTLTSEEIEFYIKRNSNIPTLPIIEASIIPTSPTNDSMIYSNHDDDDVNITEQDKSPDWAPKHVLLPHSIKINTAAKIRRRYLRPPPLARPTNPLLFDHTYLNPTYPKQIPNDIEKLYTWLNEELKNIGHPLSMGDVLRKYRELSEEEDHYKTTRESICRDRIRTRLEKFYPNKFLFTTPNRREGTFIALNDINHYVRSAIKYAKQEKEKAADISILSSVIIPQPPPPIDYQRQTCESIMNAVRKIRLYIRDIKQISSQPPLLVRNLIGLITASEKQFDKISHEYDFYRMIDEDLFDNNKTPSKYDKNIRNMSLASDLISARHDYRVSEKHFLLADEITKKVLHCSPKQILTLLNHYGHTCSYKSYLRTKGLRQRTANEFGEEIIEEIEKMMTNEDKSSDSELDLLTL